jgi:hypothetical protein
LRAFGLPLSSRRCEVAMSTRTAGHVRGPGRRRDSCRDTGAACGSPRNQPGPQAQERAHESRKRARAPKCAPLFLGEAPRGARSRVRQGAPRRRSHRHAPVSAAPRVCTRGRSASYPRGRARPLRSCS